MNEERRLYYLCDSDTNKMILVSLTLNQIALLDFLEQNECLLDSISIQKANDNPEVIVGTEWFDYIGDGQRMVGIS